jgi:hypothetical protein
MRTIDPTRLTIRETAPRMTPVPASRRFSEVLAQGGRALLHGAVTAAAYVPGGNLLAAAVRGATVPALGTASALNGSSPAPGLSPTPESPAQPLAGNGSVGVGGDDDLLTRGQEMSMRMLRLQEAISEENRRYTALSNVMHARHEMAKNAINNIR